MSTLSKNAMPSLVNIASSAIIKTFSFFLLFPICKQNIASFEQVTSCNSCGPLKKTVYQTPVKNGFVVPSYKKESRLLISFGESNVQPTRKPNAYHEFEMCIFVTLVKIGIFVQEFILKRLQKPYAQREKTMELLRMVSFTIDDSLLKRIVSLLVEPEIFNSFFPQMPYQTKKCLNYSKEAHKLTELSIFPEITDNNKKLLQKPYAQREKTTELLGMIYLTIEGPLLKRIMFLLVDPKIIGSRFLQVPYHTKKFLNYSTEAHKLTELSLFPETTENNKKLCDSDNVVEKSLMKKAQTCFTCKESIKKKAFFDERRFGILERCDCMICYGCIRKASGITNGVVKEPVHCPSCNVKSDIVASSQLWIEGKEKVKYLETFTENLQSVGKKQIFISASLPIGKEDVWIREPSRVHFLDAFRQNFPSPIAKPESIWASVSVSKDDTWTKGSPVVSVF